MQELFPGAYKPTPTHSFMRLLAAKGLLLRCFTQNIDSLERQAGTDPGLIVAAHGNFDTAACIKCGAKVDIGEVERCVMASKVCHCQKCRGLVRKLLQLTLTRVLRRGEYAHARAARVQQGGSLLPNPFSQHRPCHASVLIVVRRLHLQRAAQPSCPPTMPLRDSCNDVFEPSLTACSPVDAVIKTNCRRG